MERKRIFLIDNYLYFFISNVKYIYKHQRVGMPNFLNFNYDSDFKDEY